jgi:LPXTG-motif cell wall-anchored protein
VLFWQVFATGDIMDTTTLLIIIVIVLLVAGGGWYGRGRWF